MVTQEKTYMIDPEFAFYGPAAFDVAKILSELLIAIFASHGQELQAKASRQEHRGAPPLDPPTTTALLLLTPSVLSLNCRTLRRRPPARPAKQSSSRGD